MAWLVAVVRCLLYPKSLVPSWYRDSRKVTALRAGMAPVGSGFSPMKTGPLLAITVIHATPGKLVYVKSVPWVRIPPRPSLRNDLSRLAGLRISSRHSLCANSLREFMQKRPA